MREWSGFGEPEQRREACEGADVEEDLVAAQRARSSSVERDLDGPLGNKAAPSHHKFATAQRTYSDAFGSGLPPSSACGPEFPASTHSLRREFRAPRSWLQYERCLPRG